MKLSFIKTISLFSLVILFMSSCEKEEQNSIINSPIRIEIEDYAFELEAYVWRDFMPGTTNSNMRSLNSLIDRNQNDISTRFELVKQYLINDSEIWEAEYTTEHYDTENHIIQKISRNGPLWETGLEIDIVCEFKDLSTNKQYEIMVKDQIINSTH